MNNGWPYTVHLIDNAECTRVVARPTAALLTYSDAKAWAAATANCGPFGVAIRRLYDGAIDWGRGFQDTEEGDQ